MQQISSDTNWLWYTSALIIPIIMAIPQWIRLLKKRTDPSKQYEVGEDTRFGYFDKLCRRIPLSRMKASCQSFYWTTQVVVFAMLIALSDIPNEAGGGLIASATTVMYLFILVQYPVTLIWCQIRLSDRQLYERGLDVKEVAAAERCFGAKPSN